MVSPEHRRRMASLGMFVLPLVMVQAASVVLRVDQPAGAEGAAAPSAPSASTPDRRPASWTPRQLDAARHATLLAHQAGMRTPFLYDLKDVPAAEPAPPSSVPVIELPTFELQAVMATETERRALINGRPYREHDSIRGTEWSVTSIDVDARQALLTERVSGRTLTIKVDSPR